MNDKPTEVPKIEEKVAPNKEGRIPVLIVDSRSPFPELALYTLDAIPRRGDLINIAITGKLVGYKVDFVTFNPFNEGHQITLGCSFFSAPTIAAAGEPVDLKERMDQVVKAQIQVFEKAQAYSNALMLGGYAGIFAVWTFSRDVLTPRTTNAAIVLVGVSLILYVSWEIFGVIQRASGAARFLALVDKSPEIVKYTSGDGKDQYTWSISHHYQPSGGARVYFPSRRTTDSLEDAEGLFRAYAESFVPDYEVLPCEGF
jgi:hypothetical protein